MGIGAVVSVTVTLHDGSNTQFMAGAPTLTTFSGVMQPVMKTRLIMAAKLIAIFLILHQILLSAYDKQIMGSRFRTVDQGRFLFP